MELGHFSGYRMVSLNRFVFFVWELTITLPTGSLDGASTVRLIGKRAELLWSLLNMSSLGTLAVFETVAFFLLLARLMNFVHHKRRTELANGMGEIHHPRGIVLMNLGMLLSLVETLIGFTQQNFVTAITRRGTRTAGRLLIISGLLKG